MSLRRSLKESNGELWQIEKVLDRKKVDGTTQYLIKWEVEDDEEIENSWHTEYELEMLNVENLHLLAEADARKKTKSNTKHHTPKKQPTAFDALAQTVHADSMSKERTFQKQQREIRAEAEKKATKEYQAHLDALHEQERLTDPPFQLDAPLHVAMLRLSGSADSEAEERECETTSATTATATATRLSAELASAWASALRIKNVFGEFLMLFMENPHGFECTLSQAPLFANYPQHTERLRQMCSQSLPFLRLYERCDSHLDWDIAKVAAPAPSPFANVTLEEMERDHPFCFPVELMVHIFEKIFPLPVNDELISTQLKANRLVCQYWYYILNQQSSWHFFTLLRFPTFKSMIQRRNNVTAYALNMDDGSLPALYETRLVTKRNLLAEISWHRTFDFLNRKWARYETIWARPANAAAFLLPFQYLDENVDVTREVLDFLFLHYIAKLGKQSTALYLNLPELSETSTFGVLAAMNYWFDNCSGVFDIPGMNAEEFGTFRTTVENLFPKSIPYEMRDKNMFWYESGSTMANQTRFLSLRAKGTKGHIVHDRKLFRSAKKRGVGWLTHSERNLPYEHYLLIDSCTPRLFVHYGGNGKLFFDKQRNAFLAKSAIERQIESEAFNLYMYEAKASEKSVSGEYKFRFRCVDQHLSPGAEISPTNLNFPRFFDCFARVRYEYLSSSLQYALDLNKTAAAKLDKIGNWDYKNVKRWTFTIQVKRIRWCPTYFQWRLFGSQDYSIDRACIILEDLEQHPNVRIDIDDPSSITNEETLRRNPYGY